MKESIAVVVAWRNEEQIKAFLDQWQQSDTHLPSWLVLQQDDHGDGCARTKNKGVQEALQRGAEIVVVLDDDCFPQPATGKLVSLEGFAQAHAQALEPQPVAMFAPVTRPPSRGTPYRQRHLNLSVAASMGFWTLHGDYDAVSELVLGPTQAMEFLQEPVFGRYFPLCGMNLAFRPRAWLPWCQFIEVPRFDDIWMGWLWQREAYRRGYCFNLNGPLVRHTRQSNVWQNLRDETRFLEQNETLWQKIATHSPGDYQSLRGLLPHCEK